MNWYDYGYNSYGTAKPKKEPTFKTYKRGAHHGITDAFDMDTSNEKDMRQGTINFLRGDTN